jgi:flagella synthesis protein FlgN
MKNSASIARLTELLDGQFNASRRLAQLLEEEHDVLVRRDLQQLTEMITRKHNLLAELQSMESDLSAFLGNLQLSADRSGIENFISSQNGGARNAIENLWRDLQQTAKHCRKQNQINQKVLDQSMQQVQQTLGILTGQPAQPAMYKPSGKTGNDTIRQSFGAA